MRCVLCTQFNIVTALLLVSCLVHVVDCIREMFGRKTPEQTISETCYENKIELCGECKDYVDQFSNIFGTDEESRTPNWYRKCEFLVQKTTEMESKNVIVAENYGQEEVSGGIKICHYTTPTPDGVGYYTNTPLPKVCPEDPAAKHVSDIDAEATEFIKEQDQKDQDESRGW